MTNKELENQNKVLNADKELLEKLEIKFKGEEEKE